MLKLSRSRRKRSCVGVNLPSVRSTPEDAPQTSAPLAQITTEVYRMRGDHILPAHITIIHIVIYP